MSDKSQRTEKPTPRRLEKAREEGNFPNSREFVASMQFLGFVTIVSAWGVQWFFETNVEFRRLLSEAFTTELNLQALTGLLRESAFRAFRPLAIAGAVLLALSLLIQMVVTGLGFSFGKLAPDFKRLNPMPKLSEMKSQNLSALTQSIVLMAVITVVLYNFGEEYLPSLLTLPRRSTMAGAAMVGDILQQLLWKLAGVLLAFGCIDFIRQRFRFAKSMRMSKQEIREEMKSSEGDQQIKSRIRSLRRRMLRGSMMKEVPTATLVIVNPVHYAVALRYDPETMPSPVVVAMGQDHIALRIRQIAVEHGIAVVENPPLARALYRSAEIGQQIPADFYKAVAEVLAYIYKMMGRRRPA